MKIPTFRHMGGKARLRKWLVEKFPRKGNIYFEPYAGLANVFFLAANELDFQHWWLNDRFSHPFLHDLKQFGSTINLPDKITKELKLEILSNRGTLLPNLLENVITFAGKGYDHGFTGDIDIRYNPRSYEKRLKAAHDLLEKATLTCFDSENFDYSVLDETSFVYFDPPYFGTKASYPNIDHSKLIEVLNTAKFKWALSGYDNDLYSDELSYINKYHIERNSEIKSSSRKEYTAVVETLWTNY